MLCLAAFLSGIVRDITRKKERPALKENVQRTFHKSREHRLDAEGKAKVFIQVSHVHDGFFLLLRKSAPFFGYNLSQLAGRCFFFSYIILLLLLVYFGVRWAVTDRKYKIFKKHYYVYCFGLPFYLIAASMCISAFYTTIYTPSLDGGFAVDMNMTYYFLVFFPVFFGYLFFCYYAFLKKFALYSPPPLKRRKRR